MKKTATLLATCGVLFSTISYAQLAVDSIEINTLKAYVYSDGAIQGMQTLDDSTYKSLIYADGLWIAGFDGTTLRQSSQTYRQSGLDFVPGPVSNDLNADTKFDKVYRVNLQTLTDFKNGNIQGIPQEIADWPAHGDTNMGEAYYLAPFVDVNNDGNYDPVDGDYPKIKGDEAIYTIYNDVNTGSNGNGLGVEIHSMLYGYNTGGVEDSILFKEYRVINRSTVDYTDAIVSIFADFEVGNSRDDYAATSLETNSIYTYNADSDDEGPYGFGSKPVAMGLRILKGPPAVYGDMIDNNRDLCVDGVRASSGACNPEDPITAVREHVTMSSTMYYNNTFTNQGNPDVPLDFYNYMQAKWRNGNNLIIEPNGDGYVPSNTGAVSNFFFPGNSYDTSAAYEPSQPTNWSQTSQNSDSRYLANMGFISLNSEESFTISTAYIWARAENPADIFAPVNQLLDGLTQADSIYDNPPPRTVGVNSYQVNQSYLVSYKATSGNWFVSNNESTILDFVIYSTTGQRMGSFKIQANSKSQVPTQAFAKGIYLLVNAESGKTQKITK